jgi:hypothetical protein
VVFEGTRQVGVQEVDDPVLVRTGGAACGYAGMGPYR